MSKYHDKVNQLKAEIEGLKITMMVTIANIGRLTSTDALEYVRAHSLERHFNFKV